MKKIIAPILIALLLITASNGQTVKAPALVLKDINGKTIKLKDLKGKTVLLNFWATWCIPCAAEVPDLVKWQREYKDKGLRIIGITYPPTNAAAVRRFARNKKINYPIVFGSKATKKLFVASDTLPITVIIDKDGNVRDRIDGVIFADEFETRIRPLLQ